MIRVQRETSIFEKVQDRRKIRLPLSRIPDMELSLTSMILVLGCSILLINPLRQRSVERLKTLEPPLDLIPGERIITYNPRPLLIIISGSNTVNTKVNRTGTTESFTT